MISSSRLNVLKSFSPGFFILIFSFLILSCTVEPYYIIDDPYIFSGKERPKTQNISLVFKSIQMGAPIKRVVLSNRDEIALFTSKYQNKNFSKAPVVSPLIFVEGRELFFQAGIKPVVYNFQKVRLSKDLTGLVQSDREEAFIQAGEMAAKEIKEGEFLFLFISLETAQRSDEYHAFMEGFYRIKGDESLIEVKITSPSMRRAGVISNYETLIRGRHGAVQHYGIAIK